VALGVRAATIPGLDRVVAHGAHALLRPSSGERLTARGNPAARDLVRHAALGLGGNANRARSWAKAARRWPSGAQVDLLDAYPLIDVPTLLLWADSDLMHPLAIAEEALDLLPDAQLRVLEGTGFLMAYDDPVGLARELAAFCG
jgi:pimeloyl-ACP methyl ester carboxylesterase